MVTIRTAVGTENYKLAVCVFAGLKNKVRRRSGCVDKRFVKKLNSTNHGPVEGNMHRFTVIPSTQVLHVFS